MNNVYGTKKPANIGSNDVDIFYHYRPTRNSDDTNFRDFKRLSAADVLKKATFSDGSNNSAALPGMYELNLPVNVFNKKGIYTIYIKPKEIDATIEDVGVLSAYPNIKGIVIDSNKIGNDTGINGSLVGYRVEYLDDLNERDSDFRIITSNNRCEPVTQNTNSETSSSVQYKFNNSGTLVFCTLTPSTSLSFISNSIPFIGRATQRIKLINTKFNPVMMEIEMVEHDDDTISLMLEGEQLRNLEQGLITTFDENGGIYHQAKYGTAIDPETGKSHDFKINNNAAISSIESTTMEDIKGNL
jgi:hypothetical protein